MELRQELYKYRENKKRIIFLTEKIEYLRAKAEKITPTLSDDGPGSFTGNSDSKVERNAIKIIETENELNTIKVKISWCDDFLQSLKPYQRYIVKMAIVNHIPNAALAKREKTSVKNITRIIENALKTPRF